MEDTKPFRVTTGHEPVKRQIAKRLRQEMTPAESRLWQNLRANRLAGLRFRRQQILEGFIVDFYCHNCRLAIEVDGLIHEEQHAYDEERTRALDKLGVQVLRFTNTQVEQQLGRSLAASAVPHDQVFPSVPFQLLRGEASLSERGEPIL